MYGTTLPELLPMLQKGGKMIVTGVPNNLRDMILYTYCCDPDAMYYRYASTESADWDEEKEREFLKHYKGGKDSPQWKNLVMAEWGDASESVFRPSKLAENIKEIEFQFNKMDVEFYTDCITRLKEYVVKRTDYDKIQVVDDDGDDVWYYAYRFEKVEEKNMNNFTKDMLKTGMTVKLRGGNDYAVIEIVSVDAADNTCACGNTGKITFNFKKS
jgi:hypothetical protein